MKSDFGSFNCFEFSEDYKLVALGGQDDAITIVNVEEGVGFKLDCHKSFISACVFMPGIMLGVCERGLIY